MLLLSRVKIFSGPPMAVHIPSVIVLVLIVSTSQPDALASG